MSWAHAKTIKETPQKEDNYENNALQANTRIKSRENCSSIRSCYWQEQRQNTTRHSKRPLHTDESFVRGARSLPTQKNPGVTFKRASQFQLRIPLFHLPYFDNPI